MMVAGLCQKAGLPMPEVGIYRFARDERIRHRADEKEKPHRRINRPSRRRMNRDELEGVLAHEVSHIANGDMVTMTLIAGVVNAFAMFLSRVISYFVSLSVKEDVAYIVRFVLTIVLDIFFSILGSIVVAFFSRAREFRADNGGAMLAGREKMIAALENLKTQFRAHRQKGRIPGHAQDFREKHVPCPVFHSSLS